MGIQGSGLVRKLNNITTYSTQALVAMFASVFLFSSDAGALSINFSPSIGVFDRSSEVESVKNVLEAKSKKIKVELEEITEISQKKEAISENIATIAAEIEETKRQIAIKDDITVRINKFASDAAGNSYAWGNCTWYVKSKRPDIGNFWGNANSWLANAQSQGWSVGDRPKIGAVGTTSTGYYGHVVYVEDVSPDRQSITISEMNAVGLNVVSTRTASASEFRYIYALD